VDMDGDLMRRHASLTRGARQLYGTMRALADGKSGRLEVHGHLLDWEYVCREAEISRCTWLKRFRELVAAGLAGCDRPRVVRVIGGRRRVVLGRACYFVCRAPQIAENQPILLKSTFSTVEEVDRQVFQTHQEKKNQDARSRDAFRSAETAAGNAVRSPNPSSQQERQLAAAKEAFAEFRRTADQMEAFSLLLWFLFRASHPATGTGTVPNTVGYYLESRENFNVQYEDYCQGSLLETAPERFNEFAAPFLQTRNPVLLAWVIETYRAVDAQQTEEWWSDVPEVVHRKCRSRMGSEFQGPRKALIALAESVGDTFFRPGPGGSAMESEERWPVHERE